MRVANLDNRAVLVIGKAGAEQSVDIATASHGRFGPDLPAVYTAWKHFTEWASELETDKLSGCARIDRRLRAPPAPRQVFAIGLERLTSTQRNPDSLPPPTHRRCSPNTCPASVVPTARSSSRPAAVWTGKWNWSSCWAAKPAELASATPYPMWRDSLWADISERVRQMRGSAPQFGLAKSFPGFSPQGPWLVTPDEFKDPDDLELGCAVDGEEMQKGRTRDLIFPVPALVSMLSQNVTLYAGDVIFTGTPAGVGVGREPQRFLRAGERLDSWIEGIGELHQTFVADSGAR